MIYLVCTDDRCFRGFYDENNISEVIGNNENLFYIEVSKEIQRYIMTNLDDPQKPLINIDKIREDGITRLDNPEYILDTTPDVNIDKEKRRMVTNLKNVCSSFITNGILITLSDGSNKNFTYKIEDQINIRNLIDSGKDKVYYHASGEDIKLYSMEDLLIIFNSLEDYKNINLLYVNVLCRWIMENYTIEDYYNKTVIDYGYINDDIIQMMGTDFIPEQTIQNVEEL